MAGLQTVLHVVAVCLAGTHAFSDAGKYLVTAPEKAMPGVPYTLTAQVFKAAASPVTISAYLEAAAGYDPIHYQQTYRVVTPVVSHTVLPGSVETLTIQVPETIHELSGSSQYRLHVRGTGSLQIEETYSLSISKRSASLLVFMDKTSYTAGDTVTFKTFGFHLRDLTPYTGVYNVTLKAGSVVFNTWMSTRGQAVNTFHFDLDTHTITGTWTVTVGNSETGVTAQTFTVGQKPKELNAGPAAGTSGIQVKVYLPKTMNSSTDLTGSFEAAYPEGMQVRGTAEITLDSGTVMTNIVQFNGSGSFQFSYQLLRHPDSRVRVRVKDVETGLEGEGESTVMVYERDIKIQFTERTPAVYKPKLPYTAYIQVTNHADEPLHIAPDSIFSTVHIYGVGHYLRHVPSAGYRSSTYSGTYPILARQVTLPDSGLFSLDLDIPEDVTSVDLVVTFQGVQKKLTLQQAQHSEGDSYLQIYLMGHVPAVTRTQNADVKFRVLSSQPLTDLTVEMVSRGRLVSAVQPALVNKAMSGHAHTAEFSVTLTWDMTPVTEVVAYHLVLRDQAIREVVSDSMVLTVQGLLEDTIAVTADAQHVRPGQEVTLTVTSRPGAYVGILVQDSSEGTTPLITPQSILGTLQQSYLKPLKESMATSAQYATGTFTQAQLLLMSGGVLVRSQQTTPVTETPYRTSSGASPNTVYLGTNTTGVTGIATFAVTMPDRGATWSVTGFAFDDAGHVSVVDQPLQVEAMYEVYGGLLVPDRVVSGEQVVLPAFLYNARSSESQVTVTLRPKKNVQTLHISANATFQATLHDQQQTLTMPAKGSKKLFFTVTSPAGTPASTCTAEVELVVSSGKSSHAGSYFYTVAPNGVEKTFTFGDVTRVDGHVTKALTTMQQSYPKEALPQTVTTRVTVQQKFSDLLLPVVEGGRDVLEEGGTELAALLHFSLPLMLARYRPDRAAQLKGPIERGYQRLMAYLPRYGGYHSAYPGSASFDDWLTMTAMQTVAEAKRYIYVTDDEVISALFKYFRYHDSSNVLYPSLLTTANKEMTTVALEAYYSMAIQNLHNYVNVYGHRSYGQTDNYQVVMSRVHNFLLYNCNSPSSFAADALSLSYLALACVKYNFSADVPMARLMALKRSSSAGNTMFWNSAPDDNFSYFGDWMPDRHVATSADLVTAANALQVLVRSGQNADAEKVARWLFRQRSGNGLFKTAWDTLAATEALLEYENRPEARAFHVSLNGHLNGHNNTSQQWLAAAAGGGQPAHFTASGHGDVFSQVEVKYHVNSNVGDSPYEVVPVVLDASLNRFKLMVCNRWLLTARGSGETVQQVSLPSGFKTDASHLARQSGVMHLVQGSDTDFTLYFNQFQQDSSCYTVTADRMRSVAHQSPAHIYTTAFAKPEYQDITTYQIRQLSDSTVCDLCPTCCP